MGTLGEFFLFLCEQSAVFFCFGGKCSICKLWIQNCIVFDVSMNAELTLISS